MVAAEQRSVLAVTGRGEVTGPEGVNLAIALRPNDESFVARVARKRLVIEAGEPPQAEATIVGDPRAFASVTYGGRRLADAVATGDLVVTGSMAAADSFLHLHSLPPAAST